MVREVSCGEQWGIQLVDGVCVSWGWGKVLFSGSQGPPTLPGEVVEGETVSTEFAGYVDEVSYIVPSSLGEYRIGVEADLEYCSHHRNWELILQEGLNFFSCFDGGEVMGMVLDSSACLRSLDFRNSRHFAGAWFLIAITSPLCCLS